MGRFSPALSSERYSQAFVFQTVLSLAAGEGQTTSGARDELVPRLRTGISATVGKQDTPGDRKCDNEVDEVGRVFKARGEAYQRPPRLPAISQTVAQFSTLNRSHGPRVFLCDQNGIKARSLLSDSLECLARPGSL